MAASCFYHVIILQTREDLAGRMALTRHAGLNTIRLEGKMESELFYGMMDALGLMAIPGW